MISEQVRKMTQVHWIMLFLAISVAWIFLYYYQYQMNFAYYQKFTALISLMSFV